MYRNAVHDVLTIDCQQLVMDYQNQVELCAYNSGSTIFDPVQRGLATFRPIALYPFDSWRAERGRLNAVVEITVKYSVPNIGDYTLLVERMRGDELVEVVWQR